MGVREKLVEQLRWWAAECDRTNFGCQARKLLVEAADYIAHGVTVQEWISVNDRLPEGSTYVLARLSGGAIYEALCLTKGSKQWCAINREPFVNKDTVTHWMPLPPPPKTKGDEWK